MATVPKVPHSYRHAMQPAICTEVIEYTVSGHSLTHDPAKRYGEEILALLGRVWPVIKDHKIPHDGINRVIYDADQTVFAGVILGPGAEAIPASARLERKPIRLTRYAVWTHVGPYHLLQVTGAAMARKLEAAGHHLASPMIEVYGHWTPEESKLETQTFVALR